MMSELAKLAPLLIGFIGMLSLQVGQIVTPTNFKVNVASEKRETDIDFMKSFSYIGLNNISADVLWIQFIQYYGSNVWLNDPNGDRPGYDLSSKYLESITEVNQNFFPAYQYALNAIAWKEGEPDKAKELLLRGVNQFTPSTQPLGFKLWTDIALIDLLFLGNSTGISSSYSHAADWIAQLSTADRERMSIPPAEAFRQLGNRLATNPNSSYAQYLGWSQVFYGSDDEDVRKAALSKIEQIGGQSITLPTGEVKLIPPERVNP